MSKPDPTTHTTGSITAPAQAAREQFLDAVGGLRPRLHQFCARMTGSVFDGEDIVQETLAEAFFKLAGLRDERLLEPWLFRIAHNRSIDFLRRQGHDPLSQTATAEEEAGMADTPEQRYDHALAVNSALATALTRLPPKERACIVLKDVLGYRLDEIAAIADSTPGGVKAALHRARSKLADSPDAAEADELSATELTVLSAYVHCFNAHDWQGAARLLSADARLELVGFLEAQGAEFIRSTYYRNYAGMRAEWRFELWEIDGSAVATMLRHIDGRWQRHAGFRLGIRAGKVCAIRDYIHVPYLWQAVTRERRLDSNPP